MPVQFRNFFYLLLKKGKKMVLKKSLLSKYSIICFQNPVLLVDEYRVYILACIPTRVNMLPAAPLGHSWPIQVG